MLWNKPNKKNYQTILDKLLTINHNDPALCTKQMLSRVIDLKTVIDNKKLYQFLWSHDETLTFEGNEISGDILESLEKAKNASQIFELLDDYDISISENILDNSNDFVKFKKLVGAFIQKNEILVSKRFTTLASEAKNILNNENTWVLYLGAYFVNGVDINNENVNAPLLLWEITISKKNSNIILTKNNVIPTINDKFNFYLKKTYNIDIQFNDNKLLKEIETYPKILNKILDKKDDFQKTFDKFVDAKNETSKKTFSINNSCCVLIVEPIGGIIKKDIEIIDKNRDVPFKINTKIIDNDKFENQVIDHDDIIEINQKLNIYQKYAVKSSLNQNTLIYGPPGTGKSEVVASIVANAIYAKKTVLISSEKKTALDVLENRLDKLSQIALFAYKTDDKEQFYETIKKFHHMLQKVNDERKMENSYNQYLQLKDVNANANILLDIKWENYNIDSFFEIADQIDVIKYQEYKDKNFFNFVDKLIKNNRLSLENVYDYIVNFNEQMQNHMPELNFFLSHNFDNYDSKYFKKFYDTYQTSQNNDYVISWFIMKEKIISKKPLFGTKKLLLQVDHQKILELVNTLTKLNLNDLTRHDINAMLSFDISNSELRKYFLYNSFINKFEKNKYVAQDTVDKSFNQYVTVREKNARSNVEIILNNYLRKLALVISNMAQEKQSVIFEALGMANQNKKPSVNVFIKKYYDVLRMLFPIWILSPEQTCILCPIKKEIFDYGIFDEASQMFLERSFPLVYRCKINIVAGDDKQLQPTSFFMKKFNPAEEDEITNQDSESLFEMASVCLWSKFYLKNHYRSKSADLISYSNKSFYDNTLEFSSHNNFLQKAITVYDVNGIWENNHNKDEIEKVIDLLKDQTLWNSKILIITFNAIQCKFLISAFQDAFAKTPLAEKFENEELVFKSLENVQGIEADIVILSISYAKTSSGTFRQFFGPLSMSKGANRLNVAITRAKNQMIVVKSIKASDIKFGDNANNNIFKGFLEFAEEVSERKNIIYHNAKQTELAFTNNLEKKLFDYLTSRIDPAKYIIINNLSIGKRIIDIAILEKATSRIVLGFSTVMTIKKKNFKELIEELDHYQFLIDLGYSMYRIDLLDWYLKNQKVRSEINNLLSQKL